MEILNKIKTLINQKFGSEIFIIKDDCLINNINYYEGNDISLRIDSDNSQFIIEMTGHKEIHDNIDSVVQALYDLFDFANLYD